MSRWFWIAVPFALLIFCVGTQVVLLAASVSDPSFALVPDYEERAANWDAHQAQQARNRDLDWTVELSARPGEFPGSLEIELEAFGTYGKPIRDARIVVEGFHNARAGRVQRAELRPVGDGIYVTRLAGYRPGLWQFDVEIERGDDRFTHSVRKSVR